MISDSKFDSSIDDQPTVQSIFYAWKLVSDDQFHLWNSGGDQSDVNKRREKLIALNQHLLHRATKVSAENIEEIAYKLALWRWATIREKNDAPAFNNVNDEIVYSAFLDIARMTKTDVLKKGIDLEKALSNL